MGISSSGCWSKCLNILDLHLNLILILKFRKEDWLLLEGTKHRAKLGIDQPPRFEFGIYSIRQRELSERLTRRNSVPYQSATSNSTNSAASPLAVVAVNTPVAVTDSNRSSVSRDRGVRKISEKVDTLRLHDDDRDDRKNDNAVNTPTQPLSTTATRQHTNNNPNKTTSLPSPGQPSSQRGGSPTQGDTLNQIKAMRRRHSRSVNVSASL